jgi:hypothetical protein
VAAYLYKWLIFVEAKMNHIGLRPFVDKRIAVIVAGFKWVGALSIVNLYDDCLSLFFAHLFMKLSSD